VLVVIGGGEFGTYHARQLLRARAAGAVAGEVVVVDRDPSCRAAGQLAGVDGFALAIEDWSAFLARWLSEAGPDDHLVPAPLAPHLLWSWLRDAVAGVACDPPLGWGLPYEVRGEPGVTYLSAAGWACPAACIEPAHCPRLHAPRDWDLADIIESRARALGWQPAVLRCLHLAFGIGSVKVRDVLAARDRLVVAPSGARVLVATSSHCHAAVGGLRPGRSG
jgi:hypothetical protein